MLNGECWSSIRIVFVKYCDIDKFEELEMDTDSLYLALAEKGVI